MEFLESLDSPPAKFLKPDGYNGPVDGEWRWNGPGQLGLEVVQGRSSARPSVAELRDLWRAREAKKGFPLLLVVLYPKGGVTVAATCGPTGDDPVVRHDVDPATVERLCAAALARPDRLSALRFLAAHEVEEQSQLPGVRNLGLFATNELEHGAPRRADWNEAVAAGRALTGAGNHDLLSELGYRVETNSVTTSVLVTNDRQRAVAVILGEGEDFETPTNRFESVSAVQHGLAAADRLELDWLVLVRGRTLRLYSSKTDVGVGRRGRSATYLEINLDLISEEQLGLITLCFGAGALTEGGTVTALLESSSEFVAGLGARLRDRIYFDAVPDLATVIAERHGDLTPEGLSEAYTQTMTVLFRLLFVAYGEDKDLLPYRSNGAYAEHSITRLAKALTEMRIESTPFDPHGTDLWDDVQALWTAIDKGRVNWDVPAYGGALFSSDPSVNAAGAAIARYRLTNSEIGPTLSALLVDESQDGLTGPVDFRSLSVREFGTIYEGLLESELSIAPYDLAHGKKGGLTRADRGDQILVAKGEIWFHNSSGERKSTGSYFTKPFAVEYLLDSVLSPALAAHLKEVKTLLDNGDEAGASRRLFEFRCADIAMGSGHFLVAAVDHIEAAFSRFLAETPMPRVTAELMSLRKTALDQLGDLAGSYEIDLTQVMRRLIARHCIYGVDLNLPAVELARLGIWIHTFVPGMPLSFLDRNLIVGNSLVGFGTIDEINDYLGADNLFSGLIAESISASQPALVRLATLNDATVMDVEAARQAAAEAAEKLAPVAKLLDLLALARANVADVEPTVLTDPVTVAKLHATEDRQDALTQLGPLHFPIVFPEVFTGEHPGFTCTVGNPPWDKIQVDRSKWWLRFSPGLQSLAQAEREQALDALEASFPDQVALLDAEKGRVDAVRQALLSSDYPGLGIDHPDYSKAFAWRFLRLLTPGGRCGIILPRVIISGRAMARWREQLVAEGSLQTVITIVNKDEWAFTDVHPQKQVILVVTRPPEEGGKTGLVGPFDSQAFFEEHVHKTLPLDEPTLRKFSESLELPSLGTFDIQKLAVTYRNSHPNFDSADGWRFPTVYETDATRDKRKFELDTTAMRDGFIPVYKGESIDLWLGDTGIYYAQIERATAAQLLKEKFQNSIARPSSSAFFGSSFSEDQLPYELSRLAYRWTTNATNRRTMVCALIPPDVVLTNGVPYIVAGVELAKPLAFRLGVMSSSIFDWYCRRFVEGSMRSGILNRIPMPSFTAGSEPAERARVMEIAGLISAVDDRYSKWADSVGVPVGSITSQAEREELLAELDAVVAHLYGLDVSDLETIWDTFHTTVDHLPDLEKVVEYFEEWSR